MAIPTALRYNAYDAMMDYADGSDSELVATMYRDDAEAVQNAPTVAGALVLPPMVFASAYTALVEKLAESEELAEQARRDEKNARAQYARYEDMLAKIK